NDREPRKIPSPPRDPESGASTRELAREPERAKRTQSSAAATDYHGIQMTAPRLPTAVASSSLSGPGSSTVCAAATEFPVLGHARFTGLPSGFRQRWLLAQDDGADG